MDRQTLFRLFSAFTIWRVVLFLLSVVADHFLLYKPSFSLINLTLIPSGLPRWIYSFGNFDGVHYITIARDGYKHVEGIQAFFPLFPRIIIGLFHDIFGLNTQLLGIGLMLSNLFFFGFVVLFFMLVKEIYSRRLAWITTITLLLFPTSFFFGALYTESLFMLLVTAAFYSTHKKKWFLAGLFTLFATATRIVGIFLIPALLVELYVTVIPAKAGIQSIKSSNRSGSRIRLLIAAFSGMTKAEWKNILCILLGSLGLITYMGYLHHTFGDGLLFAHVQSTFGAGRTTNSLVLYPQVVWRALKILLTSARTITYITYLQEFIVGTIGLIVLLFSWKKVRPSWFVFALLCFLFPPLSGTFSSMPRYILVCFPLYVLLAIVFEKKPQLKFVWWTISFALLCLNTVFFIQGYWVG